MFKKIINVGNFKIAYIETNADSPRTIFFIHGNSGSANTWHKQLNDTLLRSFRLVAFDLPAHSDSSEAILEDDYNYLAFGKLMADAINTLSNSEPFVIVGFSLGSNVLAETLPHLQSPNGLVLVGSSVIGTGYMPDKVFLPTADGTVFFSDEALEANIQKFPDNIIFFSDEKEKKAMIADYKKVKKGFRPTMMKTALEGKISDEIVLLKQSKIAVLVIFGKQEKMANPDYLNDKPFTVWKNKIHQLSEAGHAAHIDQPSAFNKLLLEYAVDAFEELQSSLSLNYMKLP